MFAHVSACVFPHVSACVCACVCVCISKCVCVCLRTYLSMFAHVSACVSVCVSAYVCKCVCLCLHMCLRVFADHQQTLLLGRCLAQGVFIRNSWLGGLLIGRLHEYSAASTFDHLPHRGNLVKESIKVISTWTYNSMLTYLLLNDILVGCFVFDILYFCILQILELVGRMGLGWQLIFLTACWRPWYNTDNCSAHDMTMVTTTMMTMVTRPIEDCFDYESDHNNRDLKCHFKQLASFLGEACSSQMISVIAILLSLACRIWHGHMWN